MSIRRAHRLHHRRRHKHRHDLRRHRHRRRQETTLSVHSALFENHTGVGLAFSHRFNTDVPLAIDGGFSHAASENVGRIGMSVES